MSSTRALHYAADSSLSLELAHSDRSLTRLLHRTRLRDFGSRANAGAEKETITGPGAEDRNMDVDEERFKVPARPLADESAADSSSQQSVIYYL